MTRFDAATADARQELFADAIRAHTERNSAFLTIEATTDDTDEGAGESSEPTPWIQYADGTLNLDCTDDELDRLKSLLDGFPSFTIDDLATPEDVDGTNVRVTARTDDERIAEFADRVFRQVYDRSKGYRAWVAAI
ncbi:hypothetical protein [Halococcus saccharolyticus]|uniref:DUF7975 domain-containing protein n=1 Tax=Halococcus saccharolyticus DSM 5350 TaxID=1227455 RepID=M0ME41_9EURY|nr:hypothetical protein [Halococcus saccharolyticus]EMA44017.1 hypothetical protein C449_10843 [Halococcus saccharolyticus DSM 5350]